MQVAPVTFKKEEDPSEGVRSGVLECPEPTVTQWFTFHYACTKSGNASKTALLAICHAQEFMSLSAFWITVEVEIVAVLQVITVVEGLPSIMPKVLHVPVE